jgi:hypothetical protein
MVKSELTAAELAEQVDHVLLSHPGDTAIGSAHLLQRFGHRKQLGSDHAARASQRPVDAIGEGASPAEAGAVEPGGRGSSGPARRASWAVPSARHGAVVGDDARRTWPEGTLVR